MPSVKGRARLFAAERPTKDLDPEAEAPISDEDGASDSDTSAQDAGADTEHYISVGRSKLRQKQPLALGTAYRGVRVSRAQLDEESEGEFAEDDDDEKEEFDDPDDVDLDGAEEVDDDNDGEIDSDDAFGSSDGELVQKFVFRGSSKPRDGSEGSEEEDDDEEDDDEEDDEDDEEGDDGEDDDRIDQQTAKAQAATRKILAEDRQRVLAPMAQAAQAEAAKGMAVRQQRRAFDALLNMRIRMQKALVAANSLHVADTTEAVDPTAAAGVVAEAVALLTGIQDLRQSLYAEGDLTRKRRRADVASPTLCTDLFADMAATERAAQAKRRRVIDRWAARVHRPTGTASAASRRLGGAGSAAQALTSVLDEQLATAEARLVRRTRVPRSCAPVQAARRVAEDGAVYDDADFYQLLLKELVDQRSADTAAPGSALPTVRWAASAAKEARTRKVVDRKASKGRKMRFNVHEKLQNFMAPDDRRRWEPEAIDRLFGSLFGQRTALREDDEDDSDEDGGVDLEEEGLRLFRS